MSGSSDEILHALAQHGQEDSQHPTINILFVHCDSSLSDRILSQLRTARFAPRGEAIHHHSELKHALDKRSWDLLIFAQKQDYLTGLTPEDTIELLHHLDRDLPVLLLTPGAELIDPTHWLGNGVQAVVCEHNTELLLLLLRREFEALNMRRELRSSRSQLNHLQERCERLVTHSSLAICYIQDGLIQFANASFAELFGYDSDRQLHEHSLRQLLQSDCRDDLDLLLHDSLQNGSRVQRTLTVERPDKTEFEGLFTIFPAPYRGENHLGIEVTTDLYEADEVLRDRHPGTGLITQSAFMEALETAGQNAHRGGQDRSLLLLSLDHLDVIRGEVGSEGVELILSNIAAILKQDVNRAHLVGHLDDDSFAILMHNADPDKAVALGNTLCHTISNHVCDIQQTAIHTTVSVGVVMVNDSSPSAPEMIARARLSADALRHGNRPGNGVNLYHSEQTRLAVADEKMGKRLLNALKLDRFRLLFQPVVPLRLDPPAPYYEVLLRLISDSDRQLSPDLFIAPNIEPSVLVEVDRWVIKKALASLEQMPAAARTHLLINLSGASLRAPELLDWLYDLLRLSRVPAELLIFQISESDAAVNLMEACVFTQGLKRLNCKVCLKHFGSSPNSEHVRRELDTEYVKLDGSYVQDLGNRNIKLDQLQGLLSPLQSQRKLIIAPLVENTRVISDLYTAGVHLIQGYYLQPPREQMDYDFFNEGQS